MVEAGPLMLPRYVKRQPRPSPGSPAPLYPASSRVQGVYKGCSLGAHVPARCASLVHPVCSPCTQREATKEWAWRDAGWGLGFPGPSHSVSFCGYGTCGSQRGGEGRIMALVTWSGPFQPFFSWQMATKTFWPGRGRPNRAVYCAVISHWPSASGRPRFGGRRVQRADRQREAAAAGPADTARFGPDAGVEVLGPVGHFANGFENAVQEGVGIGRAAGDVDIHRDDFVHAADAGVVLAEDTAAAGTGADGHDEPRRRAWPRRSCAGPIPCCARPVR